MCRTWRDRIAPVYRRVLARSMPARGATAGVVSNVVRSWWSLPVLRQKIDREFRGTMYTPLFVCFRLHCRRCPKDVSTKVGYGRAGIVQQPGSRRIADLQQFLIQFCHLPSAIAGTVGRARRPITDGALHLHDRSFGIVERERESPI